MPNKLYKNSESEPITVNEPVAVYEAEAVKTVSSDRWNPNVPFHGTQEEWWDHFHRIEKGDFMTLEEFDRKFEVWKKNRLERK